MPEQHHANEPHRIWGIPELVDLIIQFCGATQVKFQSDERTLSVLARTCHALQELSLNLLWKQQHTLMNLVKLLPEALWSTKDTVNDITGQTFRHLVSQWSCYVMGSDSTDAPQTATHRSQTYRCQ